MGYCICPHNIGGACCDNPTPIEFLSDTYAQCDNGMCLYTQQFNLLYSSNSQLETIEQRLCSIEEAVRNSDTDTLISQIARIKANIGANGDAGDDTIADRIDTLITKLGSVDDNISDIRANLGATGADDGTIAGRLDELVETAETSNNNLSDIRNDTEHIASSIYT